MASVPAPSVSAMHAALRRWTLVLALAAALATLIAHFVFQAESATTLIRYPYGVDYGEGIVWQQMRNIMRGTGYAPIGVFPAVVYHYPPVFHVIVGITARVLGTDELATGRAVSWIATLGCATLIGALVMTLGRERKDRLAGLIAGLLAALMFMSTDPVMDWAPLMRVDMPAYLFGLAGLVLANRAVDRPGMLWAAAVCFTLAVYTKQVSLAAPAAAFVGLLVVRPRRAWALAAITTTLGGTLLLLLSWATGGGFLRHIILYNVNRVRPEQIGALVYPIHMHILYVVLACAGAVLLVRRIRALWPVRTTHAAEVTTPVAAIAYFTLKTLMLAMIMKSGSSLNYVIEWFCAVAILAGVAVRPAVELTLAYVRGRDIRPGASVLVPASLFLAIAIQVQELPRRPDTMDIDDARAQAARLAPLVALIRATPKPVISDDMTLLIRAGRDVQWEPAIAAELGAAGRYDQAAFARMIRNKRFGLFITEGDRGGAMFKQRYNPPVAEAMASAYPNTSVLGRFTIHAPRR